MMVLDQRELDLARVVGLADRPVSAAQFRSSILDGKHDNAGRKNHVGEGSAYSHKSSPLSSYGDGRLGRPSVGKAPRSKHNRDLEIGRGIQNSQLPKLNQFLQRQVLEAVHLHPLD